MVGERANDRAGFVSNRVLMPLINEAFYAWMDGVAKPEDIDQIMQASDLFVLSSAWEGFPYVIIEALANRLRIVCTDVGGNSEGVLDNVTGFLVPPDDSTALAQRIDDLVENADLRAAFSDNGRKLFYEKFLDETMLARIDEVYRAMLTAD